jgi:hypothetical protein
MSTHEFAKLLLEAEDKPFYVQENYEHMGEYSTGYSDIEGIDDSLVEDGYILKTNYLQGKPNDNKYSKGDAVVNTKIKTNRQSLDFCYDDIINMIFNKTSTYYNYHTGSVSFYVIDEDNDVSLLEHKLKIAITSGFKPEWQEMTIQESIDWYNENFENYLKEGF